MLAPRFVCADSVSFRSELNTAPEGERLAPDTDTMKTRIIFSDIDGTLAHPLVDGMQLTQNINGTLACTFTGASEVGIHRYFPNASALYAYRLEGS